MKHVVFTEEAERDLAEATAWFDEHTGIGGAGFAAQIDEVVNDICKAPFAVPPGAMRRSSGPGRCDASPIA